MALKLSTCKLLIASAALSVVCGITNPLMAQQPNIVFIMADDLGWSDTSNALTNMGNPSDFYETPTLERLASEGMAFTNAYTNGPNCAPTRTALLTGQWAQRPTNNVYLVDNLNRGGSSTLLRGPSQGLPSGTDAIPNNSYTYGEMLQDAGYQTAYFGKFHVVESGNAASDVVNFHGFHENYGGNTSGGPGRYHASNGQFGGSISPSLDAYAADYTQAYVDANIKPYANGTSLAAIDALVGTDKHVSDALADAAIDFMDRSKSGPFLVNLSPYAVHTPIGNSEARDDLLNKYNNKPPGQADSNDSFGALIEGMDQSIGRVVNYLESTADPNNPGQMLSENTILFFYSDNGGKQSQSNNGPLRGQKGELLEGGVRVPMIAWSQNPALVDGGTVNDTPVQGFDFYQTFASLSDATLSGTILDGEDLSPILADSTASLGREDIFWHLPGYLVGGGRNLRPASIIRNGDHKLWYNYEDQSFELYDLATDIGENDNILFQEPQLLSQMSAELIQWLDDTDAPLATLRSGTLDIVLNGLVYRNGEVSMHTFESVTIQAGEEVPFVGDVFSDADLDLNGFVDSLDWAQFRSGQGIDMSGFTVLEAYQLGDLDHDFDNDVFDFLLFKDAYDLYNGDGAFAALVPEPSGWGLALMGLVAFSRRRNGRAGQRRLS